MFPTQSKVNRLGQLVLLPAVALALLLVAYAIFAGGSAQAQTPTGDYCIEGVVINWREEPLAGWVITLTNNGDMTSTMVNTTTTSAFDPDEDADDPDFERGEFKFSGLPATPGLVYTATIEMREGWEGVTPTTITFAIEGGNEDCVQIRFKMRRIVPVVVYKIDADHDPLNDWIITAIPGPGNLFASPEVEETGVNSVVVTSGPVTMLMTTTENVSGTALFSLTPGLWIFEERPPRGNDEDEETGAEINDIDEAYRPVVPPSGRLEVEIEFDDDIVEVVFKNELVTGCILVRKVADAMDDPILGLGDSYDVAGWGFQLLRRDGSIARKGVTGGNGELMFDSLPLGPYVLVEEDRPGWEEIDFEEIDINVTGDMCDDEDAIVFENVQDESGFCIEGRKIDANGGYGISGWEIDADPLADGGFEPDEVLTDGIGEFTIEFPRDDYRIPGALYEVCEEEVDGWLPHTASCITVRLPEWPSACIEIPDFVNQQVGHTASEKYGEKHEFDLGDYQDDLYDKDADKYGAPDKGGPDKQGPDKGGQSYGGPNQGGPDNGVRCNTYHVVKAGEGLFEIGSNYKVSPQGMLDANPDVRDSKDYVIQVGQRICIP